MPSYGNNEIAVRSGQLIKMRDKNGKKKFVSLPEVPYAMANGAKIIGPDGAIIDPKFIDVTWGIGRNPVAQKAIDPGPQYGGICFLPDVPPHFGIGRKHKV